MCSWSFGADAAGQSEPICVGDPEVCCPSVHQEDGREFFFCDLPTDQANAASLCTEAGGRLAKATSVTVNAGITPDTILGVWIDGNDNAVEDDWRYADGTALTYFDWAPDEPDGSTGENCLHILTDGKFRDVNCSLSLRFVCEIDSVVEPPDCGNGLPDDGEQCDDGNVSNRDSCLNDCEPARCGDSYTERGVEECDDGNTANGDACNSDCTKPAMSSTPRTSEAENASGCTLGHRRPALLAWLCVGLAVGVLLRRRQ